MISELTAKIESILRIEDVEGLIELGAPADEYASEARDIALAIAKLHPSPITETSVVAIIALVWGKSFDRSAKEIEQRLPAFRRIAQRILQSL
jgi:hypothetical protein